MQHRETNQFLRNVVDHMPGWSFRAPTNGDDAACGRIVREDGLELYTHIYKGKYTFTMSMTAAVYRFADAPDHATSARYFADTRKYGMSGYESLPTAGGTVSLGAKRAARRILGALVTERAETLHTENIRQKQTHDAYVTKKAGLARRLGLDGESGFTRFGETRVEYEVLGDVVDLKIDSLTAEQAEQVLAVLTGPQ